MRLLPPILYMPILKLPCPTNSSCILLHRNICMFHFHMKRDYGIVNHCMDGTSLVICCDISVKNLTWWLSNKEGCVWYFGIFCRPCRILWRHYQLENVQVVTVLKTEERAEILCFNPVRDCSFPLWILHLYDICNVHKNNDTVTDI